MAVRLTVESRLLRTLFILAASAVFLILFAPRAMATGTDPDDEILFYREDGLFRYYDMAADGTVGSPIQAGDGYTKGWTSIVAVDLDGKGQDELFFYRSDGLFRFYDVKANGNVGKPLLEGSGYSKGWTSIVAVDLDGDGQDEMFFYRASDGLFRYYNVKPNGSVGTPIAAGNYHAGWSSIVALDLEGDGQDELLFYRTDGKYDFYNVHANGSVGSPIRSGIDLVGWDSITAIDLNGDRKHELLFYKKDGSYLYSNIGSTGQLGSVIQQGTGYTKNWSAITALNLHGDLPVHRVSRFTTYFNCCEARVTNIRTMARKVNGTVVMPGETFSIDALIGPRTSAKGYVPAGYLQNGVGYCCAVGGGVSQFGTTIHNAVFWGGFQVVSHRPHTGWISRYPLGIEATLVYQSIDYKFRNDTATPITIRTSSTGSSVTVELWGNQGGWQVSGQHPKGNRSSSISVLSQGGSDAKRVSATVTGSAPGVVRITRRLTQNGSTRTQTWTWHYVS